MDFRLLGPLEVLDRGQRLAVGGPRVRALLAMLLLDADRTVGVQQLTDGLWGDRPPASTRQALHFLVHRLRRSLAGRGLDSGGGGGGHGLVTTDAGYRLRLGTDSLDVADFERLLAEARAIKEAATASSAAGARAKLVVALALWRGDALADLRDAPFAAIAATRLDELRTAAQAERIQLELQLGRHAALIGELEALVHAHPLREQLRAQLALALYRSGRQADALAVCRDARATLVEELGIEPGPDLVRLERAILTQDTALDLRSTGPVPVVPAAASGAGRRPEPVRREERRVVTVLVAMAQAGGAAIDPEDAKARHAAARAELAAVAGRFGGTTLASVGGTTMAVFGAPVAHDDDPERAVRAALALRAGWEAEGAGSELPAASREAASLGSPARSAAGIGVQTGPALVTIESGAGVGPAAAAVAGPVMDAAAAMAAAAPPGGVLVGAGTEQATRRTIGYSPHDGPPGAGPAFEALAPHARTGAVAPPRLRSPLVEREHEVALVAGLLARARREREPQLVTLVGGPGIGKSRLVLELGELVEADPDLVAWRQGRCLAYGEGVTFWALGEIVKAHAGILDSDPAEEADAKLARAAADTIGGEPEQAAWVAQHLRTLVRTEPGRAELHGSGPNLGAFAAWRRLIAAMAAERPLVLVFEDLHWADDLLLDFIDELPDRVGDLPILVVCTARPELLARRPSWGGGKRNATTISLLPLSQAGTARLLDALLDKKELPEATIASVLERAGGNPLFVEEYVQMLRETGCPDAVVPVPASVQQVITARLDTLETGDKALLADAAVVGEVGWVGAVAAVSGRARAEVAEWLHRLELRDLLRRVRPAAVGGETEYAFRHVLVRDVAYGQLPRAARAERHRRAATWLASLGSERGGAGDRAELVAHHWREAVQLTRAAGPDAAAKVAELAERARVALREAGERAASLGANRRAADLFAEAVELWPEDAEGGPDLDRAELLLALGRARLMSQTAGHEALTAARDALLAAGRADRAAEAELYLFNLAWRTGRTAERAERRERLLAMVRGQPPSRSKGIVLAALASELTIVNLPEAREVAAEAIANARELGQGRLEALALGALGMAKVRQQGDPGGLDDLDRSIQILEGEHLPDQLVIHRINYAAELERLGDLAAGWASQAAARAVVAAYEGCTSPFIDDFLRGLEVKEHYWSGRWDDAVRVATALLEEASTTYMASVARVFRGRVRLARDQRDEAERDAAAGLDLARSVGDKQLLEAAIGFRARVLATLGYQAAAATLVDELLAGMGQGMYDQNLGIDLPLTMVELGLPAERLGAVGLLPSRWLDAATALLDADGACEAADTYALIGARPEAAAARLLAARRLLAAGRPAEAGAEAAQVRRFAAGVKAAGLLREVDEVLAGARDVGEAGAATGVLRRPSRNR